MVYATDVDETPAHLDVRVMTRLRQREHRGKAVVVAFKQVRPLGARAGRERALERRTKLRPASAVVLCIHQGRVHADALADVGEELRLDRAHANVFPIDGPVDTVEGSASVEQVSQEVRERALRVMFEHRGEYESQWVAIVSIAGKIGSTPQTLLNWVRQHERDTGQREGVTTAEANRVKELEREVRELRRANEILKLASAFFAQTKLDRRLK